MTGVQTCALPISIAGVRRIVAVVAHHPVIVHFKGILIGFLAVDINTVRLDLQFISFVSDNTTFVDRQVIFSQSDSSTFGGNPDRTVVVTVPFGM